MSLQQIGRFRIAEELGRGGMGIVYRARDTRLGRDVALKILPPDVVADPVRRQRFEHEARAASALQHPNIVTVYDITREDGRDVIVMEYVAGRTLDAVIAQRPGLSQTLAYAVQIVDALSSAHAAGIVHRDLKPSNVMVTPDGIVKILDFGLAKLTEVEPAAARETVSVAHDEGVLTLAGSIVGTAVYMSPEQARGEDVDTRSDVFSFGSVLYEMVTGRRAFQRPTTTETLRAVVREDPPPASALVPSLPPALDRVIERCLKKDPRGRWQHLSDLKLVLEDLKEDSDSGRVGPVAPPARRRGAAAWTAGAVVLTAAAAAVVWMILTRARPDDAALVTTRVTYDAGFTDFPTTSADGRLFAFASDRAEPGNIDVWVQQAAGGPPLRRTDSPEREWMPALSPDGARVVFGSGRDGGGLFVTGALAGDARRITDRGAFPRFSPDGSQIAFVDLPPAIHPARIRLVSPEGGESRVFHPEMNVQSAGISSHAVWSPDGRHLLFLGQRDGERASTDWWVAPVAGGDAKRLGALDRLHITLPFGMPRAWTRDYVYYVAGTTVEGVNIFRVPFRLEALEFAGEAEALTSGPGMKWMVALGNDGRMLFPQLSWTLNVWSARAAPDGGVASSAIEPLTQDETVKMSATISRDGSTLAYSAFSGFQSGGSEVRVRDLASGREWTVPPVPSANDRRPVLSADGRTVAHLKISGARPAYFVRTAGTSDDRELCSGCDVRGFFAGAQDVLMQVGARELVRQQVSSGTRTTLLRVEPETILDASLSWDDRWIALLLQREEGQLTIAVTHAGHRTGAAPVLLRIASEDRHVLASPRWSPDGTWLYYVSSRDGWACIWAQRLDPATHEPRGTPAAVLHLHGPQGMSFPFSRPPLDVARDRLVFTLGYARGNLFSAQLERW